MDQTVKAVERFTVMDHARRTLENTRISDQTLRAIESYGALDQTRKTLHRLEVMAALPTMSAVLETTTRSQPIFAAAQLAQLSQPPFAAAQLAQLSQPVLAAEAWRPLSELYSQQSLVASVSAQLAQHRAIRTLALNRASKATLSRLTSMAAEVASAYEAAPETERFIVEAQAAVENPESVVLLRELVAAAQQPSKTTPMQRAMCFLAIYAAILATVQVHGATWVLHELERLWWLLRWHGY
jgi:hypothetical protein